MTRDIRVRKIRAFEQERFARALAQRIAEAVAEVQGGGMSAFAEGPVGMSGCGQVFR